MCALRKCWRGRVWRLFDISARSHRTGWDVKEVWWWWRFCHHDRWMGNSISVWFEGFGTLHCLLWNRIEYKRFNCCCLRGTQEYICRSGFEKVGGGGYINIHISNNCTVLYVYYFLEWQDMNIHPARQSTTQKGPMTHSLTHYAIRSNISISKPRLSKTRLALDLNICHRTLP